MSFPPDAHLTRDHFESRARRTTAVIAALRQLATDERGQPGASRGHLHRAIAEYEADVAAISAQLREL